jgi:hypothetical protein
MSTTPTTELNPSEAVNITLANGSVIKGATLQEAFDNLRGMYENTQSWAREQKQKAEDAAAEAERLRQEYAERQAAEIQPQTMQPYDRERYFELLNEDPLQAQNYLDQIRFGTQDPVGEFQRMRQSVDSLEACPKIEV